MERSRWYRDRRVWLEAFALVNLGFLAPDIYLAHSVNLFRRSAEYIPLVFSLIAPVVLLAGLIALHYTSSLLWWRWFWVSGGLDGGSGRNHGPDLAPGEPVLL
jgi:hypothetical protein